MDHIVENYHCKGGYITLFFKIINSFMNMCVFIFNACMNLCVSWTCRSLKSPEDGADALGLELQTVMIHHEDSGN